MQKKYSLFFLLFTVVAFTSCIKKEVTPLGDEGKTFVKIVGGGSPAEINKNPIDFVATPQRLLACDIRKDVANNAALNTVTTVAWVVRIPSSSKPVNLPSRFISTSPMQRFSTRVLYMQSGLPLHL